MARRLARTRQSTQRTNRGERHRQSSNQQGYFIYGYHAVVSALHNQGRDKLKLHTTKPIMDKLTQIESLQPLWNQLPIHFADRHFFIDKLGDVSHQQIALETKPLPMIDLKHFLDHILQIKQQSSACFLLLDKLQDPHNIGAIIRSASFFNISAVILPERHTAPESAVMVKSASGGFDALPIIRVNNVTETLRLLKRYDCWSYGLAEQAEADLADTHFDNKSVIILGQEGEGLSHLLSTEIDFFVKIPNPHNGKVTSLNVSNASAIALYQWRQQRG